MADYFYGQERDREKEREKGVVREKERLKGVEKENKRERESKYLAGIY